ncbi:MAG: DUF3332 family protein [Bdellovibrionota bacterium]
MSLFGKQMRLGIMLFAAGIMSLATGCASGGFKLTRSYAGFVNKQNIILRIILYILTSIVFAVTMLIDMVVFNTMDFWNGRVSQGDYKFDQDGTAYAVNHKILDNGLRRSHIEVFNQETNTKIQDVVLQETPEFDIEVFVNGKLKGRVADISSVPQVSLFNSKGEATTRPLWSDVEWLAIK